MTSAKATHTYRTLETLARWFTTLIVIAPIQQCMEMDDNPFSTMDHIFSDKRPLKDDSFRPDKIFHRDDEIGDLVGALQDVVMGHDPNNTFIYGPTGVGKTAVTKWAREKLIEQAQVENIDLTVVGPVNCRNYKSAYRLVSGIVNRFRSAENQLPKSGYSTDTVFQFLYDEIADTSGNVIIILDEIDNIPSDARNDFLYDLPRASSSEDTPIDDVGVGLIGISNDLKFVDVLEPKVKSTLSEREVNFSPYDANELRDILSYYADLSFKDGVLKGDVVPLAAASAAQERGDVRQGLKILEKAGEFARREDSKEVTEEYTRRAIDSIETDEIKRYLNDELSLHQALSYLATTFAVISPEVKAKTREVHRIYEGLCESRDTSAKSPRKLYEFLDQLSMYHLITSRERNLGRKGGRTFIYEVTDDPADIILGAGKSQYSSLITPRVVEVLAEHKDRQPDSFDLQTAEPIEHLQFFDDVLNDK
jgi:cell division control protein 6